MLPTWTISFNQMTYNDADLICFGSRYLYGFTLAIDINLQFEPMSLLLSNILGWILPFIIYELTADERCLVAYVFMYSCMGQRPI